MTIHQPEHAPWLGFFDKAREADVLVLLDRTQFRKNYFQNRNRIRGDRGAIWLTVPVLTKGRSTQPIDEVLIDERTNPRWREKCWASLSQHYQQAEWWAAHRPALEALYHTRWERLVDLNEAWITYLLNALSIRAKVMKASSLSVDGERSELLLAICRELCAGTYLSGISGKDYLDLHAFDRAGIAVEFQEFHHPIYRQRYEPFVPCLSAADLLLNHGPSSRDILEGVGVPVMQELFT